MQRLVHCGGLSSDRGYLAGIWKMTETGMKSNIRAKLINRVSITIYFCTTLYGLDSLVSSRIGITILSSLQNHSFPVK